MSLSLIPSKNKRLIIVDISSFIFRAFYGIRVLNSPEGTPVNALHGILGMFLKLFSDFKPTHLIVAKDLKGGSFRNKLYSEYKANRSEPPEDLVPQFPLIFKMLELMDVKSCELSGFEADDIVGSLCAKYKDSFEEILIASGDKDLMQLVAGSIKMLDTMKAKIYDREAVFNKMGVYPEQIIDFLAIMGDSSDNIPGMRGIGAKGAAKLLAAYSTFENIIEHKDELRGKKIMNAFANHLQDGILSKKLVSLDCSLNFDFKEKDLEYKFYPSDELINFLQSLGFKTAIKRLKELKQIDDSLLNVNREQLNFAVNLDTEESKKEENAVDYTSQFVVEEKTISWLQDNISNLSLVYIFIDENENLLLSSNSSYKASRLFLFKNFAPALSYLLEQPIDLVSSNFKNIFLKLFKTTHPQINSLTNFYDLPLMHFFLDSSRKIELADLYLKYDNSILQLGSINSIVALNKIFEKVKDNLQSKELLALYLKQEHKMPIVLANIEHNGVFCKTDFFQELETRYSKQVLDIERQIKSYSKNLTLNLNSPKQLAIFLFEELKFTPGKKTKSGYSTDVEVLEFLSRGQHPVPNILLEFRHLSKLLTTYIKVLPKLADSNSLIHPNFLLDGTVTGRLSCKDPNLQNIPVRSKSGLEIRKGFVARSDDNILLGADYSQIELRLLAHLSQDPIMLNSFKHNKDIHSMIAAEIFEKDIEQISHSERSVAKTINFGLMYGQGAFSLSKQLNISRKEAKNYIESYFDRFKDVKIYLSGLRDFAHLHGYAQTISGKRRELKHINSSNKMEKASAERIAINTPIQGSAAELIKIAMLNLYQSMQSMKLKSKMILQIHDELIFDADKEELDVLERLVREKMEGAMSLSIPLKVDINIGSNWSDLK